MFPKMKSNGILKARLVAGGDSMMFMTNISDLHLLFIWKTCFNIATYVYILIEKNTTKYTRIIIVRLEPNIIKHLSNVHTIVLKQ